MKIDAKWMHLPASIVIMQALAKAGKQAFFVGGCVRNHLLGAAISDLDIATDARPEQTLKIMEKAGLRTIPTGIEHGTVTALSGGAAYEITTFRRDVETDGRRAVVAFSTDILDDARRRDFTMNALYAGINGEVLDPLNGLPDLRARRVRFIENAGDRIAEDYLRILRFFRFHAWYGDPTGGLDVEGLAACAAGVEGINTLSKERIGSEMRKLLGATDPAPSLASMSHCGALMRILPGANPSAIAPLVHFECQAGIAPSWQRRLAALGGERPMENLRLSKAEARRLAAVLKLVSAGSTPAEAGYRHGEDIAKDSVLVTAASLSMPVPSNSFAEIERGATARFPVQAKDFQGKLEGKELGDKLKALEKRWVNSGLHASQAELLD